MTTDREKPLGFNVEICVNLGPSYRPEYLALVPPKPFVISM